MTQRSPIYGRVEPREHPRNLLTWTNGVQQGLQPTPFIQRQWDWPNPVRAIVNSDLRTWIDCLPQSALSLTVPAGQRQRDWPNPLPYRQNPGLLGFNGAPQIAAQVVVSLPFNQTDWPNPQAWRQSPDLRIWVDGIPQTALSLTIPLRQADWPNPVLATRSAALALGDVWQSPALALSLVLVPNVVGETQAQAETDIAAVGFTANETFGYSDTVAAGLVISQNPVGGSMVPPASIVSIVISLGAQPVSDVVPAGKHRRRLYVEIDGQSFQVDTESQALELLQHARALAEHQAEQKAEVATKRLRRREIVPRVQLGIPEITVSPDLQAATASVIADIERLYKRAAEMAELRLLLARQMADEEDDDDVLLLI